VPVPDYTAKCTILVTTGKAKYDATKKAIVSIKRHMGYALSILIFLHFSAILAFVLCAVLGDPVGSHSARTQHPALAESSALLPQRQPTLTPPVSPSPAVAPALLHLPTCLPACLSGQVWKIKRFTGAAEHSLRAEVTMVSTTKERKPWARPPISMNFQVGAGQNAADVHHIYRSSRCCCPYGHLQAVFAASRCCNDFPHAMFSSTGHWLQQWVNAHPLTRPLLFSTCAGAHVLCQRAACGVPEDLGAAPGQPVPSGEVGAQAVQERRLPHTHMTCGLTVVAADAAAAAAAAACTRWSTSCSRCHADRKLAAVSVGLCTCSYLGFSVQVQLPTQIAACKLWAMPSCLRVGLVCISVPHPFA